MRRIGAYQHGDITVSVVQIIIVIGWIVHGYIDVICACKVHA